jgi:hypothetical protein
MSRAHSKSTVIIMNGTDISQHCDSSEHHAKADVQDVTTYGKDAHVKDSGLTDGTGSIGGLYDSSTSSGPRAILQPLIGAGAVPYVRRVEGTGAGKPQDAVNVIISEYVETSPVTDWVRWTASLEYSDDIDSTPQ